MLRTVKKIVNLWVSIDHKQISFLMVYSFGTVSLHSNGTHQGGICVVYIFCIHCTNCKGRIIKVKIYTCIHYPAFTQGYNQNRYSKRPFLKFSVKGGGDTLIVLLLICFVFIYLLLQCILSPTVCTCGFIAFTHFVNLLMCYSCYC